MQAAIAPFNPWQPYGAIYIRNYGTRTIARGGAYDSGSDAGISALMAIYPPDTAFVNIGFRPVFLVA